MNIPQRTLAVITALAGLALLAWGAWGAWLPHPTAGLNILGVDLAEYVKFVPQVQSGAVRLNRLIFFTPFLALALGLILIATVQRPALPVWLRILLVLLAAPVALSMLPPAWTPPLLRTPEFRTQTLWIALLLALIVLSPLLRRFLPDFVRGLLLAVTALLVVPAIMSFSSLLPALETLYKQALQPGTAWYLAAAGALLMGTGGLWLAVAARPRRDGVASHSA